jgi:hypothetical protein
MLLGIGCLIKIDALFWLKNGPITAVIDLH